MNKLDANLNNNQVDLNQNASAEDVMLIHFSGHEMTNITSAPDLELLLPDNKGVVQGVLNDFKEITGKDLLKNFLFIWLLFICLYGTFNGRRGFNSGTDDRTTGTAALYNYTKSAPGLLEKNHLITDNLENKETLGESEVLLPRQNNLNNLRRNTSAKNNLLSPASPPELILSDVQINNTTTSNISTPDSTTMRSYENRVAIHAFDFINNRKNNYWIPLNDTKIETKNYLRQSTDYNYSSDNTSRFKSSINCGLYEESPINKPELIKIQSFKGKEVSLLNSYINGYLKTEMEIRKDMVVCILSDGMISTSNCDLAFNPEGIADNSLIASCEPFIKKFHLGALLFRFGQHDTWKPYIASQTKIIAEKDGILEFMINLKLPTKNIVRGSYIVGVSTSEAK